MALSDPQELIKTLCARETEGEWYEFKKGAFDPDDFGQYVSALSNAAMLAEKRHAFLIFGIDDKTHEVVGTNINLRKEKKGGEIFENWLNTRMSPRINVEFTSCEIAGRRVEIACMEPAYDRPVKFLNVGYIRIGESKRRLEDFPEKERALWALTNRHSFERGIACTHLRDYEILDQFHCRRYLLRQIDVKPESV
jgi:ATP-dependent DNA helicase RecG